MLTLDDLLPAPHFRERHERRVAAPPAAVWRAVEDLRLGDLALSRALMGIRLFPARIAGRRKPMRMVSGRLVEEGPVPVLAAEPERALVAGGVLQPWRLTGGDDPPALDATALTAFAEPGWVKVGFDFVIEQNGHGTRLTTETRITATDPRTRARFGLYWLVIRPGSGLIRRDMLRAIARRAEAEGAAGPGPPLRDRRTSTAAGEGGVSRAAAVYRGAALHRHNVTLSHPSGPACHETPPLPAQRDTWRAERPGVSRNAAPTGTT